MATKAQVYAALADDTARRITGDYLDWAAFLGTSSRLYKYPFRDQLLIYAQRPDATACAGYDLWNNTMHRYVRRGSKGIALLAAGPSGMGVRYVFDVSDTGARRGSRSVEPWQLSERTEQPVREMLEANFDADAEMPLAEQINQIASQQALAYWRDHRRDILDSVADSFLSEYDEFNIGASFRQAATASIAYSLQLRCGLEPELYREDFTEILNFNTPATAGELGNAVSMITGQVLRQIELTIRQTERSMEHDRTEVQAERGLSVARPGADRSGADAAGQVRPAETALSGGESSGAVHEADAQREADGAPAGDRADGAEPARKPDERADEASGRDGGAEGAGSDDLGAEHERAAGAGRGDDPVGADLRLTDYDPVLEQMSFIIPGESEQIALIEHMEAESVLATPFAFSVPQEDMDDILRTGSNTTNHRLILVAEFSKGKPVEEMAQFLRQVYHGSNGMAMEHGRISAWYAEDGIRFAPGGSARYTRIAQVMSWEDAARRIEELLESGQFLSMMELATVPAHERAMIAQRLWNLYGDTTPDGKVFLSSLEPIRGGGFPDETARLAERLADPAFLNGITAEMDAFADAYAQNRNLLRFHFHNPAALAQSLRELALPRREYESLLTEVARPAAFITEDEIDDALSRGSLMAGGKGRIYRFFTAYPAHTPKGKADFLKREYGIGGRSHAVSGSDRSGESHDGKGIKLEKEGCPAVQLSWAQVTKRIDAMIARDRYMTQSELESIGVLQEAEEVQAETIEHAPESDFSDGVEANVEMPADDESIDTEAVRERLADAGIINGEVVDEEALRNSPFIRQVTEITEQIQAEQDSEELPVPNAGEGSPESAAQEHPYKVGDTVYLDDRPFVITQIGHFNVQLRDPSLDYPIFRSESIERFEQLLMMDERNTGLLSSETVKEGHTFTTETEAVYPGEKNGLPYDVVIERLRVEEPAHHQPSQPAAVNYRITDDHLGEGGAKAKFGSNLAAIRTLKQIEAEGRTATPEEQEILSRYVGWGGLADAFDPDKPAWADEYRQLAAMLTSQEYEAARASTLNAHYTSPVVIRAMYDAVAQMGFTGGNILEIKVAC